MNNQAIILTDERPKPARGANLNGARDGRHGQGAPLTNGHPMPSKSDPRNPLNDLTSTEWLPETISVWTQRGLGAGHADAQIERQHPAPFSFTDVSRLIRFFTKRGGVVLDPFVGVGSTLKACALEGRAGIGFELNPKYAKLAKERLRTEVRDLWATADSQEVRVGDARTLVRELLENSLDFVVTSPFRDKSRFVLFHADLAHALESYGFETRGLSVLYQRHKRVFPYGYPYAYVPNIHHQFILILQNVKK